ncbi:MAG TPA: hypothetical protein PKE45_02675, partial [Caldilineaceae bacterium]|nr:hypothetical protein [Caldilineaceae bacterium]
RCKPRSSPPNPPRGGGGEVFFPNPTPQPPPVEHLDLVAYSFNPQVHAFDNSSLVETVAAQPETAASAHQFCGDRPLYLGPVTLRPRFNPAATGPEIAPDPDQLPPQVDVRQMSLFGAGWTLGSIKYLAESGDVASVTYYETSGWCGVMEKPAGSPLPDQFQSFADSVFPLYHVLADVGEFADGQVLAARSSQPLQVDGLVLEKAGRRRAILANLSDTPQSVRLADLGAQVRLRVLDETTAEWAMQEPEPFRATGEVLVTDAGSLTLDLNPFAVVTIDVL